ncbi:MAG: hypothetical protein WEB60_09975 [Terrimicrobiaceae bacterium]
MTGTQILINLVRTLEKAGVPYMIVGSYSSNFYGIPRSTKDADVVVNLDQADWGKLVSLLPPEFELEQQSSFELVTTTRKELIKVKGSPFELELFYLSKDAHDRIRFERRHTVEISPGVNACLPTVEDVIIQKLRWSRGAKRSKDFADVVAVLQVQGPARLDWPYIEEWCAKHQTLDLLAEAKTEAIPAWEDA